MTAGFLKSWDSRLDVYSAGTNPSPKVNPFAVQAMKEVGIDISGSYPKSVTQFVGQSFDYVVTVCDDADENCPNFTVKSASGSTSLFLTLHRRPAPMRRRWPSSVRFVTIFRSASVSSMRMTDPGNGGADFHLFVRRSGAPQRGRVAA